MTHHDPGKVVANNQYQTLTGAHHLPPQDLAFTFGLYTLGIDIDEFLAIFKKN